jgi:hypothetical protein
MYLLPSIAIAGANRKTVVTFPTEGCWRVTGTVGHTSLTFVTFVTYVITHEHMTTK